MLNIFQKAKHPVIFFPEGHNTYILIKQFLMTGCLFTKKFIRKKYIAGVLHVWVNLSRSLHVN